MLKRKHFRFVSAIVVFVAVFTFVFPASAAGESVSIDSFDTSSCIGGASGVVTHVNGTSAAYIRFSLLNTSKGTASSFTPSIAPSGTYFFGVSMPASTEVGDSMVMWIELLDSGSAVVANTQLAYACGSAAGAGPDMGTLTSDAVVGRFVANTAIMQTPGVVLQPEVVMEVGKTLWVLGVDETGMYYKVLLSGQPFWVPVGSMGPNYDEVWNGTPLPTTTVY